VSEVIKTVAKKISLPEWWVEAIAIEYTDCRDFATRDEIWTFNFDRVSQGELEEAVRSRKIVVYGTIFHNIHIDVFRNRLIQGLAGGIPVPLVKEPDDAVVEGPISDYHFSFLGNPKDFQVYDEGRLWQWQIADFVRVEGRNYGKWISSDVDLEPLDQMNDKLSSLRNPIIKPGEPGHAEFEVKVREFYKWLDEVREPILRALEDVHRAKRNSQRTFSKITKYPPPPLSRFETFTVQDGEIQTSLFAAPIFYRAARQHAIHAEKLINSEHSDLELVDKLDEIYQERAIAIIMCSACLEAFINSVGLEHYPNIWGHLEKLRIEDKYKVFLELKGKGTLFRTDQLPYQFLSQLNNSRNSLVHFKSSYYKIKKYGKSFVTHAEFHDMPRQLVRDLPDHLQQLIRQLCQDASIPVPKWLTPRPELGWLT
jgi:hypothetical protein